MTRPHRSRTGFTLIEVVAALAILGGLLTAASVARGRLARQDRVSRDRQLAVTLLEAWADRHWERRDAWAGWAAGAGPGGGILELVEEEDRDGPLRRAEAWRLDLELVDALEPRVEGVSALRLRVLEERQTRRGTGPSPLAVLDVLVSDPVELP